MDAEVSANLQKILDYLTTVTQESKKEIKQPSQKY